MTTRINPPTFNKDKTYECFKLELLAWKEITDLRPDKQGIAIALSLPEDDESKIREKVFDQIPLEDFKSYDGLTVLLNFLNKHLAKDELSDSLEKFEDFEDYKRAEGQSINEYVAEFDAKYRKVEKKKMILPPEILAFKLIRKANITKEEKLLVLTGMNYENKIILYEEAKKSLKKFKGCDSDCSSSTEPAVKLGPTYLTENEEAFLAAGYIKGKQLGKQGTENREETWQRWRPWRGGLGGKQFSGTEYRKQGSRRGYQQTQFASRVNQPSDRSRKNINPLGPDGQVLTCKSCGSYRHLLPACPDSWENMRKVNVVQEEHAVLFTGYDIEEVRRLGVDACNCAVLDSACSSTVCGDSWINNYIQSLDKNDRQKLTGQGRESFQVWRRNMLTINGRIQITCCDCWQRGHH